MSEFKVRVQNLYSTMDSMEQLETVLKQSANEVLTIKRNLTAQIRQRERIDNRLVAASNQLGTQGQSVGRAVSVGRQVAALYQENEEHLIQSCSHSEVKPNLPNSKIIDIISKLQMIEISPEKLTVLGPGGQAPSAITSAIDLFPLLWDRFFPSNPLISGEIEGGLNFFGIDVSGKASGEILGYQYKKTSSAEWDTQKGKIGISAKREFELYGAKGEASWNIGNIIHNSAEGELLSGTVSGTIGATLFKDGRLDPSLEAKISAGGSVASGKVEQTVGSDDFNYHSSAKGELLTAEAEAKVSLGKDGIEVSTGAEAYVAKGKISGGFTLFGIKFDATLEGKAGGAGAKVGGSAGPDSVSGEIGAGLGLGVGLKVKIDWSNAFWTKWWK